MTNENLTSCVRHPMTDDALFKVHPQITDSFKNALILDFEAVPGGSIFHIGAVFRGETLSITNIRHLKSALEKLDVFAGEAEAVLGHNILRHDLALARDVWPEARFLSLPVIDTLFLSPLAFPENPYHRLVKDYKLVRSSRNDPVSDARLAWDVFTDQVAALTKLNAEVPDLLALYQFAFDTAEHRGLFEVFQRMAGPGPCPDPADILFRRLARGKACPHGLATVWTLCADDPQKRPMLAYLASWLRVSGGNSILPPWVKHAFPDILGLLRLLRYACGDGLCPYCGEHHHPETLLKSFFGFDRFRTLDDGRELQKEIVEASLAGRSHLAILPTGGGKSLCYQIPALHRHQRLGELTVVISPLKALMKDQVDNLNHATGLASAAAINGSLTLPERGAVMEKVRLGDVALLYISPEQLRNAGVAELIHTRDVGFWVFDEAHCLSKWGHDFRPDYLHVSDFIARYSKTCGREPHVGAFTATAKHDVVEEIVTHVRDVLNLELGLFMGDVHRENLAFQVWPVTKNDKFDVVAECLGEYMAGKEGGAIVYCATRKGTENLSRFLTDRGIAAQAFHAGRSEPDKRNIQDDFIAGTVSVICATNAFGMGIDKKDIRLVIHADTPGSLENYLQEAGRAGRDLNPSDCILLFEADDIETQFSLNARSRLSFKDIRKILAALKRKGLNTPELVITPGEIMRLIGYKDGADDDARARTGVSWLERKGFVERSFNQTLFFKGIPRVKDLAEAERALDALHLSALMKSIYLQVIKTLFNAPRDGVISADLICSELGKIDGLPAEFQESRQVMRLLNSMAEAGLVRQGVVMTAFVKPKGKGGAYGLLDFFSRAETAMLDIMADLAPDAGLSPETPETLNLRVMSQQLKDRGFAAVNVETVDRMLRVLASDTGEHRNRSLKIAGRRGMEQQRVFVNAPLVEVKRRATLRHNGSKVCLDAVIARLAPEHRAGQAQVLSEFFMSDLVGALEGNLDFYGYGGDAPALVETCLLYLHDMKIITLRNGLGVFRQAMSLTLLPESRERLYTRGDYEPLEHHYSQKNVQVHVMDRYARLGLEKIRTALGFVGDYFSMPFDRFVNRYFKDQKKIIETSMTADAYQKIIQSLGNPVQESIVAAPPEKNILVLAGPGSGKTRTIVHRCAWLIKAKSVPPAAVLVLCFNHQAMIELRKRIKDLVGTLSESVTALTYHGFAMRLTGRSLIGQGAQQALTAEDVRFDAIIDEAIALLEGQGREEAEGRDDRDALLSPYRYILVDEYQDIDARQYRFISALTGRLEKDSDARTAIMAVGDDDQSIYGFRHANVEFIRRFTDDYRAETFFMVENYRSVQPVIDAANTLIARNRDRMKTDRPGQLDRRRKKAAKRKRADNPPFPVHRVHVPDTVSQAVYVAETVKRTLSENPGMTAGDIAVVSRLGIAHPYLVALRLAFARDGIPFSYSLRNSSGFPLIRVREIQALLDYLGANRTASMTGGDLKREILALLPSPSVWSDHVAAMLDAWMQLVPDNRAVSLEQAREFVLETLLEERREHRTGQGVYMGTVHSVKGLEFHSVFILDGGWTRKNLEEERRLFYVGMTRAKEGLYLFQFENSLNPHAAVFKDHPRVRDIEAPLAGLSGYSGDLTVSVIGLSDLYLSHAGLCPSSDAIHARLSACRAGDRVTIRPGQNRLRLTDASGGTLALFSRQGTTRWEPLAAGVVNARILGMIRRKRTDGEPLENLNIRVDSWEIPVVEVLHRKT